jgi:hypothetical protein
MARRRAARGPLVGAVAYTFGGLATDAYASSTECGLTYSNGAAFIHQAVRSVYGRSL